MKVKLLTAIAFIFVLSACGNGVNEGSQLEPKGTEALGIKVETTTETTPEVAESAKEPTASEHLPEVLGHYNIVFNYKNHVYDYELKANWNNVIIKPEVASREFTEKTAEYYAMGFDILLDGTLKLFEEMDADASGNITESEWGDLESDFSFENFAHEGAINFSDFSRFTAQFMGMDLYCDSHTLTQPEKEGIEIEDDGGAAIKILRAGEGGAYLNTGFGEMTFPQGTTFIELFGSYDIYGQNDSGGFGTELSSGFAQPMLSMMIEQDDEKAAKGALGFSSIVDKSEFDKIFSGGTFELNYKGEYEGSVMDEYHLKIIPAK